jgi:signal transduction histidine kinase
MLDDLLDVSRVARGKISLHPVQLDLARLIRDVAEDHRHALEGGGLTLTLDLPKTPVWIAGDPTRLAQIAGNLLQNAGKFTDSGGEVTVMLNAIRQESTRRHGDEGKGSQFEQQRVFACLRRSLLCAVFPVALRVSPGTRPPSLRSSPAPC